MVLFYHLKKSNFLNHTYYFDDYKAFSFKEISGNYEGFISEEGYLNGLGIVIDNEKKYGSVGNFVNGIENGKHLHITNDGFYGYEYDMGVVIDEQKFGFAGGDAKEFGDVFFVVLTLLYTYQGLTLLYTY